MLRCYLSIYTHIKIIFDIPTSSCKQSIQVLVKLKNIRIIIRRPLDICSLLISEPRYSI